MPGFHFQPRQENRTSRVFARSPPETSAQSFCKRLIEFCKEISEKLLRLGIFVERVVSGNRNHINGAFGKAPVFTP